MTSPLILVVWFVNIAVLAGVLLIVLSDPPLVWMDDRGRLTPVDVVWGVAGLTVLVIGIRVTYSVFSYSADQLDPGEAYLFQLIMPALLLTLIITMWLTATAAGGVRR